MKKYVLIGLIGLVVLTPLFLFAGHDEKHTLSQLTDRLVALQLQLPTALNEQNSLRRFQQELQDILSQLEAINQRKQQSLPPPPPPLPPSSGEYQFTQWLTIGSRGQEVVNLQTVLSQDHAIYPEGEISGYFGTLTQTAVQRFQCKYQIVCSGTPNTTGYGATGPQTRGKLNELNPQSASSSETDEIRVVFPYLRDYFVPQVTNLAFHREIKCKHFKEKNCSGVKLTYSGGSVSSSSFTPSPYTASESVDQQNGILVWQVPKTARTYTILFDLNTMAQEDINGFYQTCPTDITTRCNTKLQNGGYTSLSFSHVAGVNETVHLFGIQDDVWNSGVGGYLTGKHSVRFFGDEASFVIPIPTDPFTRTVVSIFLNYFLFSGNTLKSAAHLDGLPYQMPVDTSLALDCKMHYFSNAAPGSTEASLIDAVKNQWQQAMGNMFTLTVSHGSGKTIADVPTSLSEGACNKGNRCGEDGTNDIILTNDGAIEFYKNLVQDSESGDINDLLESLFGAKSVGAAALWYGFTGSQGNNDVAVILKSMKILIQTFGLNLANADHVKAFKMMLGHELSHALFGRGANDVMYYDDVGNLHIPQEILAKIQEVYKHCASQSKGGEQPYHPLISVEN